MPIFDTHAHYDADRFDSDRDALLSAMPGVGVGLVLDPGCDLPSSRAAAELAERYPHVYAAVGIHPEDCDGFQDERSDGAAAAFGAAQGGGHRGDRTGLLLGGQSAQSVSADGIPQAAGTGGGAGSAGDRP